MDINMNYDKVELMASYSDKKNRLVKNLLVQAGNITIKEAYEAISKMMVKRYSNIIEYCKD